MMRKMRMARTFLPPSTALKHASSPERRKRGGKPFLPFFSHSSKRRRIVPLPDRGRIGIGRDAPCFLFFSYPTAIQLPPPFFLLQRTSGLHRPAVEPPRGNRTPFSLFAPHERARHEDFLFCFVGEIPPRAACCSRRLFFFFFFFTGPQTMVAVQPLSPSVVAGIAVAFFFFFLAGRVHGHSRHCPAFSHR